MYLPDGLLTLGEVKHDVDVDPHIIAPDPFSSDDCLNAFPPIYLSLLTTTEDNTMNTSENEPSSGLNGRLRPRKLTVLSSQSQKTVRKSEGRTAQDKLNRTSDSTPSKASQNIPDDLTNKSDFSPNPHFLCPYCDKKFASKQTVSKHARRMHVSALNQDSISGCLFCNHVEPDPNDIIRHMVDSHPNQYFACFDCHVRFTSTSELAEHKVNVCEKQKVSYRSKLRQKVSSEARKSKKSLNIDKKDEFQNNFKEIQDSHDFNGMVISCELKPPQVRDEADIEDNITTNLILPPSKIIGNNAVIEKSAVIVLDDLQWNKRIPPNFSFHNSDADQILSRLGVVHRSPRTGESNKRDWSRTFDDSTQKFEKCFDTSFYTKVASNVHENLSKFLDGSFNFNPDPDSMIKTRRSKNSVVINTAEGFPILLAGNQFSRSVFDGYLPRGIAPKHKWKWDNIESEKILLNPDQIKRDSHTNNCIITLISSLDIGTQLCMRRKFEEKFSSLPLEKKTEKQNIIGKELKEILESREIPRSSQVVRYTSKPTQNSVAHDFPASLGLTPSVPGFDLRPAVLSGEWVRPRCYVCCACGAQSRNSRALSSHIATQHPNAQVQHYEIVGEPLLNADILKHLYVPPSQMCNRTRPLRGFRECTKCRKSVTLEDLHQHMLDCAGDTPTVRRRQCRYRPFGVRKRRPRLPDNTIRKKIRKDIRSRHRRQKNRLRSRPRIRTEVGDAETIRKMIADLPAKRHRVMVNPLNQNLRPRRKLDNQRNKMIIKRHSSEELRKHPCTKIFKKALPEESTSNDCPSNNFSGKEDDDDNKPLRPKVTRMVVKRKRRSEPVKKNTVVNRVRRKSLRVKEQKASVENIDKLVQQVSGPEIEEISMDHSSDRIEVNRGSYKIREHGNRSGSNSRDDQRPGCSDSKGNSNNSVAPTQTVPLKHSIASLTANSETHDKSVQFHHLFLVQQECNNTNQSVTGHQTLFENEAAVTRLDKPPLNCSQKSQLDLYFYQKNKSSKPRKGLNDCIAMLKNKLSDPVPDIERISVQCGTDDLIELQCQEIHQNINNDRPRIDIKFRPHKGGTACRKITQELSEESNSQTDIIMQSTDDLCHQNSTDHEQLIESGHNISSQQETLPKENEIKRKSSRIKSVTQPENLLTPKDLVNLSADIEISPQISTETCLLTVSSPQKLHSRRSSDHQSVVLPESYLNISQVPDESLGNDLSQTNSHASSQIDLTWKKPLDVPPTNCSIHEQTLSVAYVQSNLNRPNQADYRAENNMTPKENNILTERSFTCNPPTDVFTACNLSDIPFDIPPAHASTNVESILTTPLDLSGTSYTKDQSKQESMTCNYDSYGTLDLSYKSSDKRLRTEITNDEVVDLRVMSSQLEYHPATIDLCVKQNNIIDTSMNNMATDLSIKGFDESESIDLSGRRVEEDLVSTSKLKESEPKQTPVIELYNKDCPTDLSSKEEKGKTDQLIIGNNEIDSVLKQDSSIKCSGNVNRDNHSALPTDLHTTSTKLATPMSKNTMEPKKMQEGKASKSMPSCVIDQSAIQTPVYDPILKIPQYKMRPTVATRATTSSIAGSTVDRLCRSSSVIVTVTNAIQSKTSQDNIFSYTKAATEASCVSGNNFFCNSKSTVTEPIPVYNLSCRVISSSGCKLESTTPVYTLANACISVTKIEQPVSSTLTSTLLNVPATTIANTTSVYTLAGPTIGATNRYNYKSDAVSQIPPADAQSFSSTTLDRFIEVETPKVNQDQKSKNNRNHDFGNNLYQDPEIARKVALLPKELVDILGNMPVDHRNQLLNILPQYVSTPAATSVSQCESTHTGTNSSALLPDEVMSTVLANKETVDNDIVPTTDIQATLCQSPNTDLPSAQVNTQYDVDRKQTLPLFLSTSPFRLPLDKGNTDEDIISLPVRALSSSNDSDQFVDATTKISLNINECSDDRIIDLTDDENLPLATDTVTVAEDLSCSIKVSSQKVPEYINVGKSRQKGNSDQTASLRAVRIKTPSERHKKNELTKNSSEKIPKSNTNDDVCEPSKPSESNKSLAIQQAEISSTQHTNKSTAIDAKFNTIHLPREFDSNAEGAIVSPQLISTLTDGFEIKKGKDSNATIGNFIDQSDVGESVPMIQMSHNKSSDEYSPDNTVSEDPQNTSNSSIIFNQTSTKELFKEISKQDSSCSGNHTDKNTEATESKTSMVSIQISKAEDHKYISKNEKNIISDNEDSEDDISLAIIIKQKQRDPHKIISSRDKNVAAKIAQCNKNTAKSKKRKQNKVNTEFATDMSSKHHITKSEFKPNHEYSVSTECYDMSYTNVTCDQIDKKSVIDSQPKASKNLKTMDNNIHDDTKKKSTKNKRKITTKQDSQSIDDELNMVRTKKDNTCTASKMTISTTNISKNQDLKPNDEVNQSVIAQADMLSTEEFASKVKVKAKEINLRESMDPVKYVLSSDVRLDNEITTNTILDKINDTTRRGKKEKSRKKKRYDSNTSNINYILNNKCKQDDKEIDFPEPNITEQNDIHISLSKSKNQVLHVLPVLDDTHGISVSSIDTIKLDSVSSTDLEAKKKFECANNLTVMEIDDVDISSDVPSRHGDAKHSVAPSLRRSRRGKSFSTDSNFTEQEITVNIETSINQKGPLTKKQVIFSKLLLDEENQTKSDYTSADQSSAVAEAEDFLYNIEPHISDDSATECATGNFSQIKRKNKSQVKRNCKKKKQMNVSDYKKDDIINKTQSMNNPSLVEYSEKHSSEVSDSKIMSIDNEETSIEHKDETRMDDYIQPNKTEESKTIVDINKTDDFTAKVDDLPKSTRTEKRKISPTPNVDCNLSSKPKKSKFNKNKVSEELNVHERLKNELYDVHKSNVNSELRPTCYNMPVAARRTRSKSVVVKSSCGDVYDPYNIELDDMIEKTPFRKRHPVSKGSINNSKLNATNLKSSSINMGTVTNINKDDTHLTTTNIFDNKLTSDSSEKNVELHIAVENDNNKSSPLNDNEIIKPLKTVIDTNLESRILKTVHDSDCDQDEAINTSGEGNISDSDDSSKSDVPLKKYADKVKKVSEISTRSKKESNGADDHRKYVSNVKPSSTTKKKKTVDCNNIGDLSISIETEKQLRSEQFMESFGFFSERKPRKSNLLASKKISETFHIIANESDDIYSDAKVRTTKKSSPKANKKSIVSQRNRKTIKKNKRSRKKAACVKYVPCYCSLCKKVFRRADNYLRHQMTLLHISKLSEIEMKMKTVPVPEEPNYLIAFKKYIDRLKILTKKLAKKKKKSKIKLPTSAEILAEVHKTVREQELSRRRLSRDEALFLDCCELLKESRKNDVPNADAAALPNNVNKLVCPAESTISVLNHVENSINDEKCDTKSDGDVDSITAKNILESEEVRNLENDLISGLKEAANVNTLNAEKNEYQHTINEVNTDSFEVCTDNFSSPNATEFHYDPMEDFDVNQEPDAPKAKKHTKTIDKIDAQQDSTHIFEDKFDKIKRKCRSQAAAAKQIQTIAESSSSRKRQKKSDKKKIKKTSKKKYHSTVLTKGALKGFDGIKVSIPTSDINLSALVPSLKNLKRKKKKKTSCKKKREKRESESNVKYDGDHRAKDGSSHKKVDVYEFMDNEDAELFELRPSTLMERIKSIYNKDLPSTSKYDPMADNADTMSESASDGDDFVYMSDDYVCSDETESSLLSCELGNVKGEGKKSSLLKRKDILEKNAVMGKIFKHNAVRCEKKSTKNKELAKSKDNLDKLFDSLLEEDPGSVNNTDSISSEKHDSEHHSSKTRNLSALDHDDTSSPTSFNHTSRHDVMTLPNQTSPKKKSSVTRYKTPKNSLSSLKKYDTDLSKDYDYYGPSTSKGTSAAFLYGPSTSKMTWSEDKKDLSPRTHDDKTSNKLDLPLQYDGSSSKDAYLLSRSNEKLTNDKEMRKIDNSEDHSAEFDSALLFDDDTGVARQRARRKCTVGKQNVLAETWSSESEPDGTPARPKSAESAMSNACRKKKGRKKDGQQPGGRRGNRHNALKKQNFESRVSSSNRNVSSTDGNSTIARGRRADEGVAEASAAGDDRADSVVICPPPAPVMPAPRGPGPSGQLGLKGRSRSVIFYWSSEGDEEQEHLQQHGWIVGDSHKKLVTMLAHAKGRKRNNDDKRHLVE